VREREEKLCVHWAKNWKFEVAHLVFKAIDESERRAIFLRKFVQTLKSRFAVNFINILLANFSYESLSSSFFYLHETREKLPKRNLYEKFARKMLKKLPLGIYFTNIFTQRFHANKKMRSFIFWQMAFGENDQQFFWALATFHVAKKVW